MNTLIDEQLMLHFGDEYRNVVSQATRFCKTVVNKPWFGENRSMLLSNEGGMPGMRRQALLSIIEKEDIIPDGLKAYGLYLRNEYGIDKTEHLVPLEDIGTATRSREPDDLQPVGLPSESPVESLQTLYGLLNSKTQLPVENVSQILTEILHSDDERELFTAYASVQDVQEAAALCAINIDDAWRIYSRVKMRVKRLV